MTEKLNTLRFLAMQLADYPAAAIRERALEMVRQIDSAKCLPPERKSGAWRDGMDPATIPGDVLLAELERRQECRQERRQKRGPTLCTICEVEPARARGMCQRCYQRHWHARIRQAERGGERRQA